MNGPILVTGARGFIGSALVAELRARAAGPLVLSHRVSSPGVEACDFADRDSVDRLLARARPRVVFHAAGTTRPLGFSGLWDAHVGATLAVLSAVRRRCPGARVVLLGSSAEYGAAAGRRPAVETLAPAPVTAYGASKLSQTLAGLSYAAEGLDVVIARVFNAIGPGIPATLALGAFARQLARSGSGPVELRAGNLSPRRDLVDVRDVARALAALGERGRSGGIYNVCSGRAVSVGEMLDRLIAVSGVDACVTIDENRRRAVDLPFIVGSFRKLERATGWRPRVPLNDSLRDALTALRRGA